jgi:hypothetical protein
MTACWHRGGVGHSASLPDRFDRAGWSRHPEANLERYEVGYCDLDTDWDYYQRIIIPLRWDTHLVGWQPVGCGPRIRRRPST